MRELRPMFCPKKNLKKNQERRNLREKTGKVQSKQHHGFFFRYEFQAEKFLKEIGESPEG